MKIFFAFPITGDRSSLENAKGIVEIIESLGHEVTTKIFFDKENMMNEEMHLSEQEKFDLDMKWLLESDMLIGEITRPSYGMGFEVGYVLGSTNKKVMLLYHRDGHGKITAMSNGNTHPNCTVFQYNTLDEVREFLQGRIGGAS